MVEFVCHVDDIVAAHHKVTRMNFIPGDYKMPAVVLEARVEAESQLVASGAGEIKTEPPSPTYDDEFHNAQHDDEFRDTQHDDDLPPSPAEEDLPPSPAEQDLLSSSEDEDRPPSPADDDLPPTRPYEVHNLSLH